jgi:protease-4
VRDDRWGERSRIGIVRVEGNIMTGGGSAGSDRVARRIRRLADDSSTKAIVVRIDSPGGDGNASDLIWRELVRARKEKGKPVVASMGDVAASGGYYVAVGADAIFAQPSTITGSIGVFVGHFDSSALLSKLGVGAVTLKRHESSDLMGVLRPTTDAEKVKLQAWVDSFYETFLSRVAEGRKLSRDGVHALAQGRVWSGTRALDKGLIDELGGLQDAIRDARKRAAMPDGEDAEIDDDLADVADLLESPLDGVSAAVERVLDAGRPDALELLRAATANSALAPAVTSALRTAAALGAPHTLRARMELDLDLR